jgi:hypothetical protein
LKSIQNKTIPIIVPYTEGRIESASDFENPVILIGGDATAEQAVGSRKGSESLDQSAGRAEGSGAEQVTGQRKASELLDQPAGRAEGSEPAEQIIELPGVTIRAIRTAHDGGEKYQIAHYSYLVEIGGVTVFVMGDASPTDENLIRAASETRVDIAGLNYVEIHREAGRKLIKNALRPSKLLLWHIPLERDDVWNQRKSVHKDMARYGAELPETAAAFECFTEIRFSNARR